MNAAPVLLLSLISDAGKRFVIPIYQRPYSWDEEECQQLWNDVLSTGRQIPRDNGHRNNHFTGSVVWIQQGTMSASGMTPSLLIDGQQRITTVMLLLVAMAEYAHGRTDDKLNFSYEEIIDRGYLVDKYKKDDSHYRLTLSQGDRETFRSILRHLEDPTIEINGGSHRLLSNLNHFRNLVANISDPNLIWNGLQRLEVVSISLTQHEDNPQLIFESMNSTGKDLSTADLVRNYVLLNLPLHEQTKVYEEQWRKIEQTLGDDSYDTVFDAFLHDWLTAILALATLVTKNIYSVFKRYAEDNGSVRNDQVTKLLQNIRRFAGYYSRIAAGKETNKRIKVILDRIHDLNLSIANPLLMTILGIYDDENSTMNENDLTNALCTVESYLFRRSVCGIPSNGLNKFFTSLIARVRGARDEGDNVTTALQALLLAERNTIRRMPDDEEFERALLTRDSYSFRNSKYMLTTLENASHPKDPIAFSKGIFTIEHIMPQNALAHEEWKTALGENPDDVYARYVNNIGNLTLTAYNSELSDGSFQKKKERACGGFNATYLTLSADLRETELWNEQTIIKRAHRLIAQALTVWPMPVISAEAAEEYEPKPKVQKQTQTITFRTLCYSGLLPSGSELTSTSTQYPAHAVVTGDYEIKLTESAEIYGSPSAAAVRVIQQAGSPRNTVNGWRFWAYNGTRLSELRNRYISEHGGIKTLQRHDARTLFWDEFVTYCSDNPDFVQAYGDQSDRTGKTASWMSFGLGHSGINSSAFLGMRDGNVGVELYMTQVNTYGAFLHNAPQINLLLKNIRGDVHWDNVDEPKKSRHIVVTRQVDFDRDHWDDLNAWLVQGLLIMHTIVDQFDE
ncbi:DUF4268 domain-containing protein [Bifidobacterium mongoliense]|uniref:DUF4268 domain-containing protein n=1 Tax=Bifidobacterium mongoliense TaxID=518643 RepID=UPI002F35E7CE